MPLLLILLIMPMKGTYIKCILLVHYLHVICILFVCYMHIDTYNIQIIYTYYTHNVHVQQWTRILSCVSYLYIICTLNVYYLYIICMLYVHRYVQYTNNILMIYK